MEFLIYLLKVSACSALLFAFYLLVLKRLTFFKINRFYLLITLLLSFTIPTLHFNLEREVEAPQMNEVIAPPTSQIQTTPIFEILTTNAEIENPLKEPFDWFTLLIYCYGLVVVLLLCLAIWRLVRLLKHAKKNIQEVNGLKFVYKSIGFTNCSFFNYVLIDENSLTKDELEVLLAHEEVHVKQFHSIDKIILTIAKAVLWFNPIVYFYDRALEQTHEFEADEATSQNFGTESYANLLLRLAIAKSEMPLVHNFVKSPIKERIKMLFNSKTKDMKKLFYLLALPIGLGLLWGFTVDVVEVSRTAEPNEVNLNKDLLALDGNPLWGKTIAGKIKSILQTEVGEILNFKYGETTVEIFNHAKGKVKVGDELFVTISGTVDDITVKDANGNIIKRLEKPCYGMSEVTKLNGDILYKSSAQDTIKSQRQKNIDKIKEYEVYRKSPVYQTRLQEMNELMGKTLTGVAGDKYENNKNVFTRGRLFKVGDKTYLLQAGYKKEDISNIVAKNDVIKVRVSNGSFSKEEPYLSLYAQTLTKDDKLLYTRPPLKQYAFLYEVNKARYATSKIKIINKNSNGKISSIVLLDKGFTIKLNVADQQFVNPGFGVGDDVIVKFIGEKLVAKDTYVTDKMIVLYSSPKKYELKNEKLFDKFYFEDGRQKVAQTKAKIDHVSYDDLKASTYIVNKPKDIPFSDAYILVSKLRQDNDSLKLYTVKGNSLIVAGKVKLNVDGYSLTAKVMNVDRYSNLITAHLATLTSPDGSSLIGDEIVFDLKNKLAKTTLANGYYKSN